MIHALPGLGADRRMFPAPWDTIPDIVCHDWPRYRGQQTLTEVARTVSEEFGIQDGDTVIGASLGGMVACEIAKIRKMRGLFLVGSAISRTEISRLLALLHPLADVAPLDALRFSARHLPSDLARMFEQADPEFIRAMCRAIFGWEGLGSRPVPCIRLHGRNDLVIPPPRQADLLVDGGHLISITHAEHCAAFVRGRLAIDSGHSSHGGKGAS